jgi:hypothetical protein
MDNNSSNPVVTAAQRLMANTKLQEEDAAAVKGYWEAVLPIPPPAQHELMLMVNTKDTSDKQKIDLEYLIQGVDAYAVQISKIEAVIAQGEKPKYSVTTVNAKNYVCATARNKYEADNPKERPPTERRRRRSMVVSDPNFSSGAYQAGTGEERQQAIGTLIAEQRANGKSKRKPQ